ncbi:MAG: exodeoxyribonuclease III [Spirochaetota bacterium]|nr:exodeoxyribonuclease III [Spirochaetota bacterium]
MKIASFNANSIRARIHVIIRWIEKERPDVLCLQETKAKDSDFPLKAIESTGYDVVYKGEKSYNGVATLSRLPFEGVSYGFDGDGNDEGTRLIVTQVKGIPVVNTYIPQGTDPSSDRFQYKLKWFDRLLQFFDKNYTKNNPLLWLGDINVAPMEIDVHDPVRLLGRVGFHPDEHRALQRVKDWGFVDVFRKHKEGAGEYTFWDYRVRDAVKRGIGWRVDHILATKPLADRSVDAWIDVEPRLWEKPSDHTFLVAEFRE